MQSGEKKDVIKKGVKKVERKKVERRVCEKEERIQKMVRRRKKKA